MSWNNVLPAEMFMDDEPIAHSHYFKDVSQLSVIDVYRTLILFAVTDPCIQHAVKKLLVAGGRGAGKDISQDIQEAIDSLERWKQMREEENPIYNRRVEDNVQVEINLPEIGEIPIFNVGDVVRVIRLVPGVPEHTYNLEGKITDLYQKGEISEHYQVTFPDLDDDCWYFSPDEIEHV